jgi:hypothetical protein
MLPGSLALTRLTQATLQRCDPLGRGHLLIAARRVLISHEQVIRAAWLVLCQPRWERAACPAPLQCGVRVSSVSTVQAATLCMFWGDMASRA